MPPATPKFCSRCDLEVVRMLGGWFCSVHHFVTPRDTLETGNPRVRNTDPKTSKDASHETSGRKTIRGTLFHEFAKLWASGDPYGYTAYEVTIEAGYVAGKQDNGVLLAKDGARRRVSDLLDEGLIEPTGITRKGLYTDAKEREVYRLSERGVTKAHQRGWL